MIRQTLTAIAMLAFASAAWGQAFTSGSTGTDGAYNPTVSGDFDPAALGINAAGDNVFNFTTINIPAGITIRLRATKVRNMPVVWLATGNVTIAGTLNLDGDNGYTLDASNQTQIAQTRRPAEPGAGGYYGGLGARGGVGPEAGAGPGGGAVGLNSGTNFCVGGAGSFIFAGSATYGTPGPVYGNTYLVPLYGGSGGGGGYGTNANALGGGGGGGGGAIRIVSTTQISVTGSILARGGTFGSFINGNGGCQGGPGAGGAIHLIAPTTTGTGNLYAYSGGNAGNQVAYNGYVRFNVTNYSFTGTANCVPGATAATNTASCTSVGPLYNVPSNTTTAQPSLVLTQVNGISVPNPPAGAYLTPDVQINANTPVTVNLSAANVPLGTTPILRVTSESGADQSITCGGLTGTLASSTSSCSVTFPFSISIASLRATW